MALIGFKASKLHQNGSTTKMSTLTGGNTLTTELDGEAIMLVVNDATLATKEDLRNQLANVVADVNRRLGFVNAPSEIAANAKIGDGKTWQY